MSVELCSIVVVSQAFGIVDADLPQLNPPMTDVPQLCGWCHFYIRPDGSGGKGECKWKPLGMPTGHKDWCGEWKVPEPRTVAITIAGE